MAAFCGHYFDDLGISINPSKTQYLQLGPQQGPVILQNKFIHPASHITVLGITFWAEGSSLDDDRAAALLEEHKRKLAKLAGLPMGQGAKEKALQMIINTKQTYFPWAYILSEQTTAQLRSRTLAVLRPQVARGPRSLGIFFGLCLKLHSTDLRTTMAWRLLHLLIKHGSYEDWCRCQQYQRQHTVPTGPWSTLAHILGIYHMQISDGMLQDCLGQYWPCATPPQPKDRTPWLHGLREAFRIPTAMKAMQHRSDMQSHEEHLDIERSTAFLRTIQLPKAQKIFEQILCGGFITGERAQRWGTTGSNRCPFCPAIDTMQHRFWRCRRWATLRDPLLTPDWRWPPCFLYTGLVTSSMTIHLADVIKIHRMYLSIMLAYQEGC